MIQQRMRGCTGELLGDAVKVGHFCYLLLLYIEVKEKGKGRGEEGASGGVEGNI